MGFKGFGRQAGIVKIEAWPILERESFTSYVIYLGRELTVHVTDGIDYESYYTSDAFTVDEGGIDAIALIEPEHVLYPSRLHTKVHTVRRRLANGYINDLHLYPILPKDFYFMAGELHALLHGPGTSFNDTEAEPVGPYGPEEAYRNLRTFAFISNHRSATK